jgi:glycosyltransferase involved in cell wall biosynthesis
MKQRTAIHYIDGREFGGSERVALSLAAGIDDTPGWRSVIASHRWPALAPLVAEARGLGLETTRLQPDGLKRLASVASMAVHMRRRRPSVFHAHLPDPLAARSGLVAAAAADVPAVIATAHLHVPLRRVWQRARARALRVDHYIAVSSAVGDGLQSLGIDPRSISVVHNGLVDVDSYAHGTVNGVSSGRTVVTVARLVEQKGHRVLLQALVDVPGVTLSLAGDGPLRAGLEHLASELGVADRTRFLGNVTDVPALLSRADMFVLTSLNEGLPLSILEAMAAGVPVVATRVGGVPEVVIDGETGILVRPEDPASTAEAIRRLLGDAGLRERLAMQARRLVRDEFTAQRMVDGVISVYEKVLARRRSGRRGTS